MSKLNPILVVGTRPELIKMAPVYDLFNKKGLNPQLVFTNQQSSLVTDLLPWFEIKDAVYLEQPTSSTLAGKFWEICKTVSTFIGEDSKKHWVFAQGDTTTVVSAAINSFYLGKNFAHVEAGLRCETPWTPFPEEGNRRIVSQLAKLNFAPTTSAVTNLVNAGIPRDRIHLVGNTGIDALLTSVEKMRSLKTVVFFTSSHETRKILITLHRRESFGKPLLEACRAIRHIAKKFDVEIVWPVHTNPSVKNVIFSQMENVSNVKLVSPLNYPDLVSVMRDCDFILTDSGGIQEEAPALGKPVLVLRNETERMELINAGGGILVGTDFHKIVDSVYRLIFDAEFFHSMKLTVSPFGQGDSAHQILNAYLEFSE